MGFTVGCLCLGKWSGFLITLLYASKSLSPLKMYRYIKHKSAFLLVFYRSSIRPQFPFSAVRLRKASPVVQPLKEKGWNHIQGFNIGQTVVSYFCVKEQYRNKRRGTFLLKSKGQYVEFYISIATYTLVICTQGAEKQL